MIIKNQSSTMSNTHRSVALLKKEANRIGVENMNNERDIQNFSAAELVINATSNNTRATYTGVRNAIENAIEYLVPAQASIREVQSLLESALEMAVQTATNPNLGSANNMEFLNENFVNILSEITNTVDTTRDGSGCKIINGEVCTTSNNALHFIRLIQRTDDVMSAPDGVHAHEAIKVLGGGKLSNDTQRKLGKVLIESQEKKNYAQTVKYLARVLSVTPNINIDTSQITALGEIQRAADIGSLLGAALSCTFVRHSGLGSSVNSRENMMARIGAMLLNEEINMTGYYQSGADKPIVGTARSTISIKMSGLLTTVEKKAIRSYIENPIAPPVAGTGTDLTGIELLPILKLIGCFNAVPGLINPMVRLGDIVGGTDTNLTNASFLKPDTVANFTHAIMSLAHSVAANAKPRNIQVGILSSDKLSLKIHNMSLSALGVSNANISTIEDAQDAITKIKSALQYVANAITRVNNQSQELQSRLGVVNINLDTINDKIADIQNVDLVGNSARLNEINHASATAAAMIAMEQSMENIMHEASQKILQNI